MLNAIQRFLNKFTGSGRMAGGFEHGEIGTGLVYLWAFKARDPLPVFFLLEFNRLKYAVMLWR